jgi:DNA polymerase III epsilon subunit-like protein
MHPLTEKTVFNSRLPAEGHDSLEDARACLELMKHKAAKDLSKLVQ